MEEQYLDEEKSRDPVTIGSIGMGYIMKRVEEHKPRKGIYTELQSLVAELRKEYGETAKKGKGSFGFYMGFLNRINISEVYAIRKLASTSKTPVKAFWWYVGNISRKHDVDKELQE